MDIEKGYTKKKYRRKIPKVVRWYDRHRNEDKTFDKSKDNESEEKTMAKSIDEQIEEMAKSMEVATTDPRDQVLKTIEELGPEGLKKALPELSDEQKIVLKSVLEETKKSMDFDQVSPKKEMTRLDRSGHELENGSDDEDEKIVAAAEKEVKHQGNADPEGFEGQVIKGKEMKEDCKKEAKKEVKDHEDKMHKMEKMKKMCKSFAEEIIKSYEDAGLEYNDELVKSQVKAKLEKAMMNKEESQVKVADQEAQGEEDKKADKKECKDIEVAKDADTKADDVKVVKKSVKFDDPNKLLKACTGGRNMHYSVNAHYDDVLAKSKEEPKAEELKKSENGELDLNDIIEKGMDSDYDSIKTDRLIKSHKTNGHLSESFASVDLYEAMGLTEEEAKEILGE